MLGIARVGEPYSLNPFEEDDSFPPSYKEFIHKSRYSRWLEGDERREEWGETVERYFAFMEKHLLEKHNYSIPDDLKSELVTAVYYHEILPSMRALQTAGVALERDNVAAYNCSYIPMNMIPSFSEAIYILMCGTGVGFSVEKRYTDELPTVPKSYAGGVHVVVDDSKYGWADAFREILESLYSGIIPTWDISKLRPAGARLKTFGGRASGPEPLQDLFAFTVGKFMSARGRKLKPIEVFDIMCEVGDVVVSGGVRRSALLVLSDLDDMEMRTAKTGKWWVENEQRGLANISVAYPSKPSWEKFSEEWSNLVQSGSGERGIFNREAANLQVPLRRASYRDWGTNPCSEIILRERQFCNLTSVVVRPEDDGESLARKVRLATVLGTFQSTITDFVYLGPEWKKNTEDERLLGVSMTGQMGNVLMNGSRGEYPLRSTLAGLKDIAVTTNKKLAEELGIPQSAAVTCVKPEGTSSQLVGAASGMHPWHSRYFVRTVRGSKDDPLTQFMIDKGIPYEDDVMKPDKTVVFSFPVMAPEGAMVREELGAIQHLELWKVYQEEWCEHKPSITVSVRPEEWENVKNWVFKNFDKISGISFLPYEDHTYRQAPYQKITERQYWSLVSMMPSSIDFEELSTYESEDHTEGSQTLACTGDSCELVDISQKE